MRSLPNRPRDGSARSNSTVLLTLCQARENCHYAKTPLIVSRLSFRAGYCEWNKASCVDIGLGRVTRR